MYNIIHISFHHLSTPHGLTRAHKWPTSNVSGFIAQLVKASNRCREVTGSNSVEVLFTIAKVTTFFAGFVIYYTFWTKRQNWGNSQHLLAGFTVRRARLWHPNKVLFLQIIRQSGCANLIDSHVSLQSLNGCNWNTVAWVVELTFLHAIVKCESLLAGHGKVCCIVSQSEMFLIVTLPLRWPRATVCVNSCMFHWNWR